MSCGGNGRDGKTPGDGKTPEEKHREHVKAMDELRAREQVWKLDIFFVHNFHLSLCGAMDNAFGL